MKTDITSVNKQGKVTKKLVLIYLNFVAIIFLFQALTAQEVVKIDDYIQELKMQKSAIKTEQANHLLSLAFDFHPTFYVNNNQIITSDSELPICGEIDYDNYQLLNSPNSKFENVELITIRLRNQPQETQKINLNQLSHLGNLKYIHFICEYSCSSSSIEQLLEGSNTEIKIFYSTIIPN